MPKKLEPRSEEFNWSPCSLSSHQQSSCQWRLFHGCNLDVTAAVGQQWWEGVDARSNLHSLLRSWLAPDRPLVYQVSCRNKGSLVIKNKSLPKWHVVGITSFCLWQIYTEGKSTHIVRREGNGEYSDTDMALIFWQLKMEWWFILCISVTGHRECTLNIISGCVCKSVSGWDKHLNWTQRSSMLPPVWMGIMQSVKDVNRTKGGKKRN